MSSLFVFATMVLFYVFISIGRGPPDLVCSNVLYNERPFSVVVVVVVISFYFVASIVCGILCAW